MNKAKKFHCSKHNPDHGQKYKSCHPKKNRYDYDIQNTYRFAGAKHISDRCDDKVILLLGNEE